MSVNNKKFCQESTIQQTSLVERSNIETEEYECHDFKKNEEIQVDFEGRNPVDIDFHGIRQLMQQLFLKSHINLCELSEIIIEQNYIGSVVIQSEADEEDDDDICDANVIFGVTSAINITFKRDYKCIQELHAHIINHAEKNAKPEVFEKFTNILKSDINHVGFLINERFVNIPAQISVPLLENLYREIKRAKDKNMPYNFKYFIMIMKLYKKKSKDSTMFEEFFSNQEEEIICKESLCNFEYSVENEADSALTGDWLEDDVILLPFRKVIILESNRLSDLILTIKEFVSHD